MLGYAGGLVWLFSICRSLDLKGLSSWMTAESPCSFSHLTQPFQAYHLLHSLVPRTSWCSKHCITLLFVLPFDKITDFKHKNLFYTLLTQLNEKPILAFTPYLYVEDIVCLQTLSPFLFFFFFFFYYCIYWYIWYRANKIILLKEEFL